MRSIRSIAQKIRANTTTLRAIAKASATGLPPPGKMSATGSARRSAAARRQGGLKDPAHAIKIL